ncbi:centrosomal protein of 152 kDa-like isoform X2 [Asterias amurensis]|uniref:centrosomal protein of 152 kDa-like isoform X2 n=1 Tax=Asterias amurensis TaxID=7602 RepID=UPI003AB1881D
MCFLKKNDVFVPMGDVELSELKDIENSLFQLRELLTTALPDDLLDDDTASFSSHESSGSLSQHHDNPQTATRSPDPWKHLRQKLPAHHRLIQHQTQQTSTPNSFSNPPPLKTPGPSHEHQASQQHYLPTKTNGAHHVHNGNKLVESSDNEWIEEHTIGQQYERGEIEGAVSDEIPETGTAFPGHEAQQRFRNNQYEQHYDVQGMENGYQDYGNHADYQATNGMNGYHHEYANEDQATNGMNGYHHEYADEGQMQNGGDEEPSYIEDTESNRPELRYNENVQQYDPSDNPKHTQQYSANAQPHHQGRNVNQPGNHGLEPSSVRVQYRGGTSQQNEPMHQANQPNGFPTVNNQATPGFTQDAEDPLQKQFLGAGGDEESRQMAQLQILYKARGRELDHLSSQLQVLKEESGREKRILNHQLALAQGEKAGVNASYEHCQELLIASQQETNELKGQLQSAHVQIQALNAAKHQVEEKLQSTEAAIESLSGQLIELQRSQPLAKAREQQDGLLKNFQQRYEQELTRLKEKVDSSQGTLEDKNNEVASLHHKLSSVTKSAEQQRLEQGNTINTLTNQLQQSQKQCRDLLETGSLQEINLLRVQLQQVEAARSFSENMTAALQEELSELKEQLQMYESAMELGVMSAKSPESTQNAKSFAVRNLAKSDWKTPQIQRPSTDPGSNMTPDDLVRGLRKELERSLQSNRTKRSQVAKLQSDLKASKADIETMRNKVLESKTTGKDTEVRLKVLEAQLQTSKSLSDNSQSSMSAESSKDLLEQINQLQSEKESNAAVLEELRSEVKHLKELNSDLKRQMAEMVADWDKDKKIDLDRVQRTCLQLHEDSSRNLREQMVTELQSERDMLKEAHQHQIQELRADLEQAQTELVDVKGLYIDVCEEKNKIQDAVTEKLKAEATKQLDQAKTEWQLQHDAALKELHESLESSHRAAMVTAKNTWRKEIEVDNQLLVEEQVALAKVEWSETVRKDAMKSALTAADAEWQVKMEAELEKRITKAKEELEKKHQEYLDNRIKELQRDHDVDKARAIKTSLSNAKTEWMIEAEANTKEKVKQAIEMTREQWTDEDADQRMVDAVSSTRRSWSDERGHSETVKQEWMQEHGEKEISRRVAEITQTLEAKHLSHITSLQELMEKGKQRLKQEMEAEKLCALQEAKNRLEREHHEALEEAMKVSRSKAENAKMENLAQTSREWQTKLDEMLKTQQEVVNKAVQDSQEEWHQRKHEMEEAHKKALECLHAEAEADQEELRSKYEKELERGLEEAVTAAREQWSQNCDAELRKTCDEILERKERIWLQEREDLQEQLKDATSQLQSSLKQGDRHRKKQVLSKQKMEKEIESLKEQLQDADREMKQTEYNLRRDLEKLQSRLKGAKEAVVEELEAKMEKMSKRHEEELIIIRQGRCDQKQLTDSTSQTNNNDWVSADVMQELKTHYITTVKKIKVDVIKRMEDMRENFRCTVHTEVMKERHATTKKLRRYYLQCLQQFLEEDSQNPRNHTKTQSTASKLAAMAKALDLQPDELTMRSPRPITSGQNMTSLTTRPSEGKRSHDSSSVDEQGNIDPISSRKGPRIEGRRPNSVPNHTSTGFRGTHDFCTQPDDKSSISQNSSNKDSSRMGQSTPRDNSASDSRKSSIDLGASSSGISWEGMETGISLGKLPIQPREFNPKPERLPSHLYHKSSGSSMSTTSSSYDSVTARSRESSPSHSVGSSKKAQIESRTHSGGQSFTKIPLSRVSLKSQESSQESSPENSTSTTNRGHLKLLNGPSRMTERNITSHSMKHKLGTKSQESSPETSATASPRSRQHTYSTSTSKVSSNITTRSRQNEKQCILSDDLISSPNSPFVKPISTFKRNADSKKGPLRVPPPSERTAAMLASMPTSILKPIPQSTRHTQIPSPGPYKPTDTSTASLDTIYNDLPASLNIQDIPHDDISLDKVVRFDCASQGKDYNYKSHTNEAVLRPYKSRKVETTSTLPSKMNLRTNVPLTRSSDKFSHMLQQDSGFVSPQVEEQI